MKKDLTEMVFILDRSGSMASMASDTIGGFNSLIRKQCEEPGEAVVTTVLFDDRYQVLHDRIPVKGVAEMTSKQYFPRGCTALLDAVGRTINTVRGTRENTKEELRPAHTIFTIITDGYENASREYTLPQVKQLIEACKQQGWEFVFLGANIDAAQTAGSMGISAEDAVDFRADADGMACTMEAVSRRSSMARGTMARSASWRSEVDEDYRSRR